ncbi:MAG: HAD hydrolase-like protein [Sporolactobacillus sp.]
MIQTILFDVDGVFLSEEHYFDASALTVWELLNSPNYLGLSGEDCFSTNYSKEQIESIRQTVFLNDEVLNQLKSRGMNANWDMIYVTFSVQLIDLIAQLPAHIREQAAQLLTAPITRATLAALRPIFRAHGVRPRFQATLAAYKDTDVMKQEIILYLNEFAAQRLAIETEVFQPKSSLWHIGEHCSQEWYVGDVHVEASTGQPSVQTGKTGFLAEEETIVPKAHVLAMFRAFREQGLTVGIATGRPALETYQPFDYLGWLDVLDREHIATADDVLKAEKSYDAAPLAKPHPFTYLLAYHGQSSDARRWTAREPECLARGEETLIVGDSLADLLCARQIGCRFAGVLTGLSGQKARSQLEAHGADYVLNSIADLPALVKELNQN